MNIHDIFRRVHLRIERGGSLLRSFRPAFFLILVTALVISGCQKEEKAGPPPPPIVEVAEVASKDVPIFAEWVGTLDGLVNATIRAQVQGYLIQRNYQEGDFVRKGQVLFEIDPRQFQAAVEQAKAILKQAQGVVAQTKSSLERSKSEVDVQDARWVTAKANLARVKPLSEQNALSQKDLDDAVGMELSTRSAVDAAKSGVAVAEANIVAAEAQVLAAQASLEKAQLNLSFTKITSPIDGIAGIAKTQIGNLVGPGSVEELTTISTIDPIKCYIAASEQEYMRAEEVRRKHPGQGRIPLELILSDGSTYPKKGEFAFADRQVDVRTGTIRVGTLFPNPQGILRPGQFGRLRAEIGIKKNALAIPQRAVSEVQGRYVVAVVGPENKVAIKPVKVGQRVGQLWVIDEGLKAGEKVVAEGIQKVRDGMTVSPKPFGTGGPEPPKGEQKPGKEPEAKPQPKTGKR